MSCPRAARRAARHPYPGDAGERLSSAQLVASGGPRCGITALNMDGHGEARGLASVSDRFGRSGPRTAAFCATRSIHGTSTAELWAPAQPRWSATSAAADIRRQRDAVGPCAARRAFRSPGSAGAPCGRRRPAARRICPDRGRDDRAVRPDRGGVVAGPVRRTPPESRSGRLSGMLWTARRPGRAP